MGKRTRKLIRERFLIGGNYFVQIGDLDFGGSGGIETIFFGRPASERAKEFTFNIPSAFIFGLRDALNQIISRSGVTEKDW